ncbi:hypothetical protein CLV92_12214 [Kineococcus xinjiangensis]|uniref:Uncharacterized protein n=1 Tax=Kineococcus xinjiangensis TaxID=512762 RepID=A0A2S6IC58_9ACTN|nr:DUF6284 family protein [Kineococcus xinjiangensis]PPK90839.1 hypothetical protein CLV92_12214 [Kineococcus xinjiangensis]
MTPHNPSSGPTTAELTAIQEEWPLIAAEVELVDAESALLRAASASCELARRRVRRAEARVAMEARAWAARCAETTSTAPVTTAGVAA